MSERKDEEELGDVMVKKESDIVEEEEVRVRLIVVAGWTIRIDCFVLSTIFLLLFIELGFLHYLSLFMLNRSDDRQYIINQQQ